jgi:hypothetical protein
MSEGYGNISSRIRRYIYGLMYLALAGFILSSISYLVNTIPEMEISTGEPVTRTITDTVVERYTGYPLLVHSTYDPFTSWCSGYCFTNFPININENPPNEKVYLIVFPIPPYFIEMRIGATVIPASALASNTTHYFYLWNSTISSIRIVSSSVNLWSEGWIRVYLVDEDLQIPPPPYYIEGGEVTRTVTRTVTEYPVKLSNKLFLGLIVFVAGIFIVLKALSYFDINL